MAIVNKIHPLNIPVHFLSSFIDMTKYVEGLEIDFEKFDDALLTEKPVKYNNCDKWEFLNITVKQNPKFHFTVLLTIFHDGDVSLSSHYIPSEKGIKPGEHHINDDYLETLKLAYSNWLELMRTYEEAETTLNSEIENKYFESFLEEMTEAESNDGADPLPVKVQELYYVRLLELSKVIEDIEEISDQEKKDVLGTIQTAIDNLGRLTRKQFNHYGAKIRAKMQKWGPKVLKQIGEALIKELTKIGVEKGMKALGDIFHHL